MSGKQLSGQMDLSNFMNMETPTVSDIERKVLGDMVVEDFSDDEELDLVKVKVEPQKRTVKKSSSKKEAVMSKYFISKDGKTAFVEYHNYNRVIYQLPGESEVDLQLDNSTDAVDKYVSIMYQLMDDKRLKEKC